MPHTFLVKAAEITTRKKVAFQENLERLGQEDAKNNSS